MATDTEIENLLALFGLRREPRDPGSDVRPQEWMVYKGQHLITSWKFDEPIEAYAEELARWS